MENKRIRKTGSITQPMIFPSLNNAGASLNNAGAGAAELPVMTIAKLEVPGNCQISKFWSVKYERFPLMVSCTLGQRIGACIMKQ